MGTHMGRIGLVLAAAVLGPVSLVDAQTDVCQEMMKPPAVGSWAEYQTNEGNLRLSVVGRETRDGEDLYWFEMQMQRDERMIIKMLLPGGLSSAEGVKEIVMKAGDKPAMLISGRAMGMMGQQIGATPQQQLADECDKSERVGPETITVPMGTMRTVHYRHPDGDAWISETVPFHLVKTVDKKGREMVLVGSGTDATSAITETPMKMPGM